MLEPDILWSVLKLLYNFKYDPFTCSSSPIIFPLALILPEAVMCPFAPFILSSFAIIVSLELIAANTAFPSTAKPPFPYWLI